MSSDSTKEKPFEVLDEEASDNKEESSGSPVIDAICSSKTDDPDSVRSVLDASPGALEAEDKEGMTPLMHAAFKGRERTIRMLLDMVRRGFLAQQPTFLTFLHPRRARMPTVAAVTRTGTARSTLLRSPAAPPAAAP